MEKNKFYTLPKLPYGYEDLEPYISKEQLKIHHSKHHQSYVNNTNLILEKIEKKRKEGAKLDSKSVLKSFSFNLGGHILHSLFWPGLVPEKSGGGGEPKGELAELLTKEFGSFERFKQEFSQAALSVEGSGWAALSYCEKTKRPFVMQVEKHNVNVFPACKFLMVLDVWEHAYYLDYKNARSEFVGAFWNIVNWEEISKRLKGHG